MTWFGIANKMPIPERDVWKCQEKQCPWLKEISDEAESL